MIYPSIFVFLVDGHAKQLRERQLGFGPPLQWAALAIVLYYTNLFTLPHQVQGQGRMNLCDGDPL